MTVATRYALTGLTLLGSSLFLNAQIFFSNGATVYALPGSVVQVNGGMTLSAASLLDNEGTITVATNPTPGTFTINGTSVAQGNGTYKVEQDWLNNSTFTENNSTAILFGNLQQNIGGTVVTTFHNLQLTGTGTGNNRQKLLNLNSGIDATGTLAINDRELATDVNTFFVANTSTACVTNNTTPGSEGFVSSLGNGTFSRQTNSTAMYLFPTGSSLGTTRYRHVEINPGSLSANTYTTRMANNDATVDLCPIANRPPNIGSLNPLYYHKIKHSAGPDNADINIFYDPSDGAFDAMAQWGTPTVATWNDLGTVNASGIQVSKSQHSDFTKDQFILGSQLEKPIIIPNIFTPDGDGVNDLFTITDAGFDQFSIEIFDRWGVKLFQSTAAEIMWDGRTTAGLPVADGTYYYILKYVTHKSQTSLNQTGFITVVRHN